MPPRRRLFLAVVVLLLVGGALAAGAAALHRRQAAQAAVATVAAGVAQDRVGPVLLVPGYGGGTGGLEVLAATLRAHGRDAIVVRLPGDATGDLRVQARALGAAVTAKLAGGAPSVDVVGYSAGGVVARIWATDLGGRRQARRIVTLGAPHHGTSVAGLAATLLPDACPTACQQLTADSELLTGLGRAPSGPVWTSVWTAYDEIVTPPQSAVLAGAVDVRLQSVCADDNVRHGMLPEDPLVQGIVVRALAVAPLRHAPTAADCAALRAAA